MKYIKLAFDEDTNIILKECASYSYMSAVKFCEKAVTDAIKQCMVNMADASVTGTRKKR